MAALTRRTWADIKTEVAARCGRSNDTVFTASAGRAEHSISDAYFDIALTFFHHELLETTTITLPSSSGINSVALAGTEYLVLAVWREGASSFTANLTPADARALLAMDRSSAGPSSWARVDQTIYLDGTIDGAAATEKIGMVDYKLPTAPDFSSGSPETGRVWDERIIQAALAILFPAQWRFDMAVVEAERLMDFAARSVHAPLRSLGLVETDGSRLRLPTGGTAG